MPPAEARPKLEKFRDEFGNKPVFLGVSNIGGRVAGDTQTTALYALLASIAMIVVYIWIRFQNVIYGVGAVVALIHDVFITVAALAISSYVAPYLGFALVEPFKISLNVVAAILTICGYSISDTIVIFDRIREVRGKSPDLTREIINLSVNQTLSRTVLTVFTVLLVTTILYISGGQAIHAFAFTMLVGLISGTYSSVYIAAPVPALDARQKVARHDPNPIGQQADFGFPCDSAVRLRFRASLRFTATVLPSCQTLPHGPDFPPELRPQVARSSDLRILCLRSVDKRTSSVLYRCRIGGDSSDKRKGAACLGVQKSCWFRLSWSPD